MNETTSLLFARQLCENSTPFASADYFASCISSIDTCEKEYWRLLSGLIRVEDSPLPEIAQKLPLHRRWTTSDYTILLENFGQCRSFHRLVATLEWLEATQSKNGGAKYWVGTSAEDYLGIFLAIRHGDFRGALKRCGSNMKLCCIVKGIQLQLGEADRPSEEFALFGEYRADFQGKKLRDNTHRLPLIASMFAELQGHSSTGEASVISEAILAALCGTVPSSAVAKSWQDTLWWKLRSELITAMSHALHHFNPSILRSGHNTTPYLQHLEKWASHRNFHEKGYNGILLDVCKEVCAVLEVEQNGLPMEVMSILTLKHFLGEDASLYDMQMSFLGEREDNNLWRVACCSALLAERYGSHSSFSEESRTVFIDRFATSLVEEVEENRAEGIDLGLRLTAKLCDHRTRSHTYANLLRCQRSRNAARNISPEGKARLEQYFVAQMFAQENNDADALQDFLLALQMNPPTHLMTKYPEADFVLLQMRIDPQGAIGGAIERLPALWGTNDTHLPVVAEVVSVLQRGGDDYAALTRWKALVGCFSSHCAHQAAVRTLKDKNVTTTGIRESRKQELQRRLEIVSFVKTALGTSTTGASDNSVEVRCVQFLLSCSSAGISVAQLEDEAKSILQIAMGAIHSLDKLKILQSLTRDSARTLLEDSRAVQLCYHKWMHGRALLAPPNRNN